MADTTKIPLVSSEITALWNAYVGESMLVCKLKHFLSRVDDYEIHSILQHNLDLCNNHISIMTNIFTQEKIPMPEGFTDSDVNINAPRLFTDNFYLQYIAYSIRIAMRMYPLYLNSIARSDIRDYFSKCNEELIDLYNRSVELSLSKGVFIRSPHIEIPKQVQYVESESFKSNLFGKKRALLSDEITHIFSITNDTEIRKAALIGFRQVCKDKKIVDYMSKVIALATKHNDELTTLLEDEDIPSPRSSDSYVTESTVSPFLDKFMLNIVLVMYRVKIGNIGMALADTKRSDLKDMLLKYLDDSMEYAKDAMDILIANRWVEQPPQAINHENLVGV